MNAKTSTRKTENRAGRAQAIEEMFAELSLEDKVKVIGALADPIRRRIDKIIRDTYDPGFGGCSTFFIEDSYVYYNSPMDNRPERFMTACSYGQENISVPLRWLDEGCDYKAEYRKICEEEEARDKARQESEEKDELRRLISKYGHLER
jgi:DNA-binding transcriptional ArsR family regulator